MKLIKNALIADGDQTKIVDILFDNKIIKIAPSISNHNAQIIDAKGNPVIPGCLDAHVHFNQPGFEYHEDFYTGTKSAAAGGISTIIDMPSTSLPPVTNVENMEHKLQAVQQNALVDFAFWGGIRANDLPDIDNQIQKLWDAGVVGFKIYTISGMDTFGALEYEEISKLLSQHQDLLFAFHAEDAQIIKKNKTKYECSHNPQNYSKIRSIEAEATAVRNILKNRNNHIHFVHISSKKAAELIINSKLQSDVTFETCPHYLQFTAEDLDKLRGRLKTAPPVKFSADREYLRNCLIDGKLDFVTTDHAGSDWETEKNLPDFSQAYNGIPGIQLMIPYLFSEFYLNDKISLARMIEITSAKAAKRFGLYPNKGSMQVGTDADFTVINLSKELIVDEKELYSKGKYSPFFEQKFNCSIAQTIVRGEIVFDENKGILAKPGYGKFLKRS